MDKKRLKRLLREVEIEGDAIFSLIGFLMNRIAFELPVIRDREGGKLLCFYAVPKERDVKKLLEETLSVPSVLVERHARRGRVAYKVAERQLKVSAQEALKVHYEKLLNDLPDRIQNAVTNATKQALEDLWFQVRAEALQSTERDLIQSLPNEMEARIVGGKIVKRQRPKQRGPKLKTDDDKAADKAAFWQDLKEAIRRLEKNASKLTKENIAKSLDISPQWLGEMCKRYAFDQAGQHFRRAVKLAKEQV